MKPLRRFFLEELRELYRREKRWLIILPEVARNLPSPDVEDAVEQHLEQTAARVIRLEEILQLMSVSDNTEVRGMKPLLREADQVLAAVTISSKAARESVGESDRALKRTARYFAAGCQN